MKLFSAISFTSAPAAKAFSDPVMTMQRTRSFASAADTAAASSRISVVQGIHRVGAVQSDQGHIVLDLDDQRLIGHVRPLRL